MHEILKKMGLRFQMIKLLKDWFKILKEIRTERLSTHEN